jgi:hypothetical protein
VRLQGTGGIAGLDAALAGLPGAPGLVFAARAGPEDGWADVERELLSAFALTQEAFGAGEPIVYLVRETDLLGQGGAPGAMLASALVSAARALAMEDRDGTIAVNVLAYDEPGAAGPLAGWIETLLGQREVTGEVVRVGRSHLGRVAP